MHLIEPDYACWKAVSSLSTMASGSSEPKERWKTYGWVKGEGIPAPTGLYSVGCVDLMHKLEGDNDGLLVRLFYPADPAAALEGAGYQYAKSRPHKRYIKGMFTYIRSKWPGLMATLGYALTGGALGLHVCIRNR